MSPPRFWTVSDANDEREVLGAFDLAVPERGRPTLIIIESHIGYGEPHKQDTIGPLPASISPPRQRGVLHHFDMQYPAGTSMVKSSTLHWLRCWDQTCDPLRPGRSHFKRGSVAGRGRLHPRRLA